MLLASNLEISLLVSRATSAEKLDHQHAWKFKLAQFRILNTVRAIAVGCAQFVYCVMSL